MGDPEVELESQVPVQVVDRVLFSSALNLAKYAGREYPTQQERVGVDSWSDFPWPRLGGSWELRKTLHRSLHLLGSWPFDPPCTTATHPEDRNWVTKEWDMEV